MPHGIGVGDEHGRTRTEPEGGDAAELLARLDQEIDEFPSPGLPLCDEGGVELGDAAGGHRAAPGRRLYVTIMDGVGVTHCRRAGAAHNRAPHART